MKSLAAREDTDMTHLTTLDELKQHIALLASVEESGAPFISAYLNLENGQADWHETLEDRARILRRVLKGDDLTDFEEQLEEVTEPVFERDKIVEVRLPTRDAETVEDMARSQGINPAELIRSWVMEKVQTPS